MEDEHFLFEINTVISQKMKGDVVIDFHPKAKGCFNDVTRLHPFQRENSKSADFPRDVKVCIGDLERSTSFYYIVRFSKDL